MQQFSISVRIDKNLKEQFDKLCDEFGLTMSTAINMFVKSVVREKRIPVDLSLHIPNKETRKAIEDADKGIGLSKVYTDMDEMFRDLDKDV